MAWIVVMIVVCSVSVRLSASKSSTDVPVVPYSIHVGYTGYRYFNVVKLDLLALTALLN